MKKDTLHYQKKTDKKIDYDTKNQNAYTLESIIKYSLFLSMVLPVLKKSKSRAR